MANKTYNLGGHELVFKDLTLDESEKVQGIINKHQGKDGVQLSFTNEELKNFLSLIMEDKLNPDYQFDFGKLKESVAAEIIRDFFLERIRSTMQSKAQFEKSMKDITGLHPN